MCDHIQAIHCVHLWPRAPYFCVHFTVLSVYMYSKIIIELTNRKSMLKLQA